VRGFKLKENVAVCKYNC